MKFLKLNLHDGPMYVNADKIVAIGQGGANNNNVIVDVGTPSDYRITFTTAKEAEERLTALLIWLEELP